MGLVQLFLIGYLQKRHHGTFVLRIEDTDEERNTNEACEAIINGLKWLGLNWDQGPSEKLRKGEYHQSQRQQIYGGLPPKS